MSKTNREVFKRALFLGPAGHTFGSAEVTTENVFHVKRIGDFGKPVPCLRAKEQNKFSYIDSPEYDPKTGDITDNVTRIFFFDLKNGDNFSFNNASSAQNMLLLKTLKTENRELKNSFQKVMQLLDAVSIDDYQ